MAKEKAITLFDLASPEIQKEISKMWNFIGQAEFISAFKVVKRLHLKYPADFLVSRSYAMMLADSAETLPPKKRRDQKRLACKMMRPLLRKPLGEPPKGIPLRDYFALRNELYFHSGQWLKQAKLGEKYLKQRPESVYSICVGYAWLSARYLCAGNIRKAQEIANKSLDHANQASRTFPAYYNIYLHLALAAGIAKSVKAAEAYLNKAATLSGKPLNYHEFEEIRYVLKYKKLKDAH